MDLNTPSSAGDSMPNGTTFSRRSSHTSQTSFQQPSPITPRPVSARSSNAPSFHRRRSSRASVASNISIGAASTNGLGNLADELGETWEQDESPVQGSSFLDGFHEGSADPAIRTLNSQYDVPRPTVQSPMSPYPEAFQPLNAAVSPPKSSKPPCSDRHQKDRSQHDGSDHGPASDTEDFTDVPPSLAKRLREIEKVTRLSTNTEDTLSEDGGIVKRTTQALKDLGPQSSIENGCTRLITAYTSLATHRTHKTRELFSQAHPLLFANSTPGSQASISTLSEELLDLLLCELSNLSTTLAPTTSQFPLLSLQILTTNTAALLTSLRGITDQLTESKQLTATATRRLKATRDLVAEMQLEEQLVEDSILLIQAGDWGRRCRERQAARSCREEVTGFQKTCDILRERWVGRCEREHGLAGFRGVKGVPVAG